MLKISYVVTVRWQLWLESFEGTTGLMSKKALAQQAVGWELGVPWIGVAHVGSLQWGFS